MPYSLKHGWFTSVNGRPVIKKPLSLSTTSWAKGFPVGLLFHYTVGCNNDISATLESKNFGATFNVGRDGSIYQYRPLMKPSWHAFGASRFYMGVEHTSLGPGTTCRLTDVQLEASAALMAAIVEWTKKAKGFAIPIVKNPAPVDCTYPPGFCDHRDGASCWNQNVHTDHLFLWTWDEYLDRVSAYLTPPTVISVVATKGERRRERVFDTLKRSWAWGKELVSHGWRVSYKRALG